MPVERPLSDDEAVRLFAPMAAAGDVLLAVSGGADSLALLVLAARWARIAGRPFLAVATVDHGLRAAAAAEAAHVAAVAGGLGLPHAILHWDGPKPRRGIEAAARAARYGLLEAHARAIGASHLATAHTRDDQAETVLLRLAAGSGPAGLAAMRPQAHRGPLIHLRPFLAVPKARLVATLQAAGVAWCEDESNGDAAFARARLRAARGVLGREGLTDARLARLAARSGRVEDAVAAAAEAGWRQMARQSSSFVEIAVPKLLDQPAEVRLRVIGRAIAAVGEGELRLARLEALVAAMEGAFGSGRRVARTLAGARVELWGERLSVAAAPQRRTLRTSQRHAASAEGPAASLGNG